MTDLHLHLDGSLSPEFILKQAQKDGVLLPADTLPSLEPYLTVGGSCGSLNEYLEKFDLPLSVLQTEDALEQGVYDLMANLAKEGLHSAEIRFAPQLHLSRGLSQEDVVRKSHFVLYAYGGQSYSERNHSCRGCAPPFFRRCRP